MRKKNRATIPVSLHDLPQHVQEKLIIQQNKIQKDFLRSRPCNLIFLLGSVGKIPSLS